MNKTPSHIQNKIAEIYEYIAKDDNGLPQVPVNLTPILEKFDIKAYNTSFKKPDIAGAFDRPNKTIFVNATDPQTRKIFTLAHELGHYFLHNNAADVLYRESKTAKNTLGSEADLFAAELLMPESVIRFYWPIAESIQQLADIFSVSYSAMLNRLRYLDFI